MQIMNLYILSQYSRVIKIVNIYLSDPASEVDNFSIVVLEVYPSRRHIVHCWTTTRSEHKEKVKKGYASETDFYAYCARKIRDLMVLFPAPSHSYGCSRWWRCSYGIFA